MTDIADSEPLSFTLPNITFEDEKLWQPRYEALVNYVRLTLDEQVRIEPAFQVRPEVDRQVAITLEIAGPGFSFRTSPGSDQVMAYAITRPDLRPVPGLDEICLVDGDPQRCRLLWNSATAFANVTTLRILCDGGRAHTPLEKTLAAVDGGLWLTLLKPFKYQVHPPFDPPPNRGPEPDFIIACDSVDEHRRPVYDLFHRLAYDKIPGGIEIEPAFRLRGDVRFDFGLSVAPLQGVRFLPAASTMKDDLQVYPFQPEDRHELNLAPTLSQVDGRRSFLSWHQPETPPGGIIGYTESFFLGTRMEEDAVVPAELRKLLLEDGRTLALSLDPTIIKPPSCDPITETCL